MHSKKLLNKMTIERICKTEEIHKRLKEEGKVRYLDSPEDIKIMEEMNEQLMRVRREFRIKEYNSEHDSNIVYMLD